MFTLSFKIDEKGFEKIKYDKYSNSIVIKCELDDIYVIPYNNIVYMRISERNPAMINLMLVNGIIKIEFETPQLLNQFLYSISNELLEFNSEKI